MNEVYYPRINIVDKSGEVIEQFGNEASSDDASATNQQAQIVLETAIRDRLSGLERPLINVVSSTVSSSGDNTIVAAPGVGLSINIAYLKIQLEAATATTVLLKGSGTKERVLCQNQGDGLAINFTQNRELRLDANTALILNLSGANSVNYTFHYFTS
jgi:hypothetical protein